MPSEGRPAESSIAHGGIDFSYLAAQTFGDVDLERELLALFVAQARSLLESLDRRDAQGRREAAHLLTGSARAIGATAVAEAAECYEKAVDHDEGSAQVRGALSEALARAEAEIAVHLGRRGPVAP